MSSASAVSICSNALLQLGDNPIASFSDPSKRAQLAANVWPQVRDMILRKSWACTRKRVVLAPESTAPSFDWGYSFLLPTDWMRTVQIGEKGEHPEFEMQGRRVLTDEATLKLVYQASIVDPAQWDAAMVDATCSELVARFAYAITQSASLAQVKRTEADRAMKDALAIAGQDDDPQDWGDHPFTDCRF